MFSRLWKRFCHRPLLRPVRGVPLRVEELEERLALASDTVGDTLATALLVPLAPGVRSSFEEAIAPAAVNLPDNDVDMYAVDLAQGDRLVVDIDARVLGSTLDSRVRVFDADGSELQGNDDAGDTDSALQFIAPETGRFFVGVSSFQNRAYDPNVANSGLAGGTGEYTINFLLPLPVADDNDTLDTAEPVDLAPGTPFTASAFLERDTDVDFYAVQLEAGDLLTVDIRAEHLGAFDSSLRVFDGDGEQVAYGEDVTSIDAGTHLFIRTAGTYFVGVSSFPDIDYDPNTPDSGSAGDTGFYEVDLLLTRPFELDNDDTTDTPHLVPFETDIETVVTGAVDHNDDVDLFALELTAGQRLFLDVDARANGSPVDATLRLFDADGLELATNDDAGDGDVDPALSFDVTSSGTYFVGVASTGYEEYDPALAFSGQDTANFFTPTVGPYTLTILVEPPRPDLLATEFSTDEEIVQWGGQVTVNYTLANQGTLNSGPFKFELRLSDDDSVDGDDMLLATIDIADIAIEQTVSGSVVVVLPGTPGEPPPGFDEPAILFLGLLVDPSGDVVERDEENNDNTGEGIDLSPLGIAPGDRAPLARDGLAEGFLASPEEEALFAVFVDQSGRLDVEVSAADGSELDPVVSLFTSDGRLLASSDDRAVDDLTAEVLQHLPRGVYFLSVTASAAGLEGGGFELTSSFRPGTLPFTEIEVGTTPSFIATGDFDGDDLPDLVTSDSGSNTITILLSNGDGTFRPPVSIEVGLKPAQATVGDFDDDGNLDLAVVDGGDGDLSILLGNGDGSFQDPEPVDVGGTHFFLITAGFDDDDILDLLLVEFGATAVAVLPGNGDGTFGDPIPTDVGAKVFAVAAGDFDGDGSIDLAVTVNESQRLLLLFGVGDGTFRVEEGPEVGEQPEAVLVADFDDDGAPDLAIAVRSSQSVEVLLGRGDGTFDARTSNFLDAAPTDLEAGDFNGDGLLDLASCNVLQNVASILVGRGDGSFAGKVPFPVGAGPLDVVSADFNGDGRADLASVNSDSDSVSVLFGRGDATFQLPLTAFVGIDPQHVAAGDFDRDGSMDLVATNKAPGTVSVLLGRGDGTFQDRRAFPVGPDPFGGSVTGDFNRDGRLDLAALNEGSISVLIGVGDGTFRDETRLEVGTGGFSILTTDLDMDGDLDLVVVNHEDDDLLVLLGNGDGTFQDQRRFPTGTRPSQVVAGDFDEDGLPDLATSNQTTGSVSVLFGLGDGDFAEPEEIAIGKFLSSMQPGDFDQDGHLDLAASSGGSDDVSILLGAGDGTFELQDSSFEVGDRPFQLISGQFNDDNGDGRVDDDDILDLATANHDSDDVSVLLGNGDGTFQDQLLFVAGDSPSSLTAGDFNGDGRADLAAVNSETNTLTLLLNAGGAFVNVADAPLGAIQATPLVADLNGDRTADLVVLRNSGEILLRLGRTRGRAGFDPPQVLNTGDFPPARAITLVSTLSRMGTRVLRLAAIDRTSGSVSVYAVGRRGAGSLIARLELPEGSIADQITSADLNGDRRGDLVVSDPGRATVSVFLGVPNGGFEESPQLDELLVGNGPSGLVVAELDEAGTQGVVLVNQNSGDVSVLINDGEGAFVRDLRFRAGSGPFNLGADLTGAEASTSRELTAGLAVGDFNADGRADVLTINPGSRSLAVMFGKGSGAFVDPQATLIDLSPIVVRVGQLTDDNDDGRTDDEDILDAVVLDARGQIAVLEGDGEGQFSEIFSAAAGNIPTGLTLHDINRDGRLDLLVGNVFGDVLILLGQGDGTFISFKRSDAASPLATVDLNGDGVQDVLLANQAQDQVSVMVRQQGGDQFLPIFSDDRTNPDLLAPGAVIWKDLNQDGLADAIVASSGGNSVLLYQNSPAGLTPAASFFVGTNPSAMIFQDLNGDGVQDLLVTNEGSNDVSILFGITQDGQWTATPGPRLQAGFGPSGIDLRDIDIRAATGNPADPGLDGIPDLVVSNNQDGIVRVLQGVGNGFFNDVNPPTLNLGASIQDLDGSFALLGDGRVVSFDFAAGVTNLFTDLRGGNALQAVTVPGVAFPALFTANDDGTVSALVSADGLHYVEAAFQANATLDNPSALAVLAESNGRVEVYVTDAGENGLIVLRFGVEELVAGLSPVDGAPLAVVATLTSSLLVDALTADTAAFVDPLAVFASEETAGGTLPVSDNGSITEGERVLSAIEEFLAARADEDAEPAAADPPTLQEFIIGLEESLRRLGWDMAEEKDQPEQEMEDSLGWGGPVRRLTEPYLHLFQLWSNASADTHSTGAPAASRPWTLDALFAEPSFLDSWSSAGEETAALSTDACPQDLESCRSDREETLSAGSQERVWTLLRSSAVLTSIFSVGPFWYSGSGRRRRGRGRSPALLRPGRVC